MAKSKSENSLYPMHIFLIDAVLKSLIESIYETDASIEMQIIKRQNLVILRGFVFSFILKIDKFRDINRILKDYETDN